MIDIEKSSLYVDSSLLYELPAIFKITEEESMQKMNRKQKVKSRVTSQPKMEYN